MTDSSEGLWTSPTAEELLDGVGAVFVGSVSWLGEEPSFVSGEAPAYQSIGFTVTEVRRGELEVGSDVEVAIPVVASSDYVTRGASGLPALDPDVFTAGNTVLVYADWLNGIWTALTVTVDRPVA